MLEQNIVLQSRWRLLSLLGDLEIGRLGGSNVHYEEMLQEWRDRSEEDEEIK